MLIREKRLTNQIGLQTDQHHLVQIVESRHHTGMRRASFEHGLYRVRWWHSEILPRRKRQFSSMELQIEADSLHNGGYFCISRDEALVEIVMGKRIPRLRVPKGCLQCEGGLLGDGIGVENARGNRLAFLVVRWRVRVIDEMKSGNEPLENEKIPPVKRAQKR